MVSDFLWNHLDEDPNWQYERGGFLQSVTAEAYRSDPFAVADQQEDDEPSRRNSESVIPTAIARDSAGLPWISILRGILEPRRDVH